MVSLSSNGLSDRNAGKQPFENGHCSTSGVPLKYKRRRVSAIRDFPLGCGRNAPLINRKPQENLVVGDKETLVVGDEENWVVGGEKGTDIVEADCVKATEAGVGSQAEEVVKSPVNPEIGESLDDLVTEVVSSVMEVVGVDKLSVGLEPLAMEVPKDIGDNEQESLKESHGVEVEALVKSVESIDVPENTTMLVIGDLSSKVVPVASEKSNDNDLEDTAPKKKYTRRTVSATRDFPPFCGRNARCPTEEERLRIVSKNNGLGGGEKTANAVVEEGSLRETVCASVEEFEKDIQDGNVQKNELKEMEPEQRKKIEKESKDVASGSKRKVGKEIVLYSHEKSRKRSPSDDHVSLGSEVDRVVVQGLMAAPNCPWRQGKGALITKPFGDMSGKKVKMHELTMQKKSKPVNRTNNKADSSKGKNLKRKTMSIGKETYGDIDDRIVGDDDDDSIAYGEEEPIISPVGSEVDSLGSEVDRVVVQGLMAAPNCPWRQGKGALITSPFGDMSGKKVKKHELTMQKKSKPVNRKNKKADSSKGKTLKRKTMSIGKETYGDIDDRIVGNDDDDSIANGEEEPIISPVGTKRQDFDVSLPPFGPNSSSIGDARNKVRETLRLFQAICRKLLQGEESKLRKGEQARSKQQEKLIKRIDLVAAKIVIDKGKEVNTEKLLLGAVPGVEVGDEFQYRVELALVGVHRLYQAGIDYMKLGKEIVAVSIVASGGYADDLDNADVLIYSGQGGITTSKGNKQFEDQKLERGNLALKNSISAENPVRVIRGSKETKASESSDTRAKVVITYTYDGLYMVKRYWQEPGPHGKLVFKFELRRISGQPELAWKEVKKSTKFKVREGLCVDDISGGRELFPICAVNTIDDEKLPEFTYITKIMYPDWFHPILPPSCDCKGGCSDSQKCSCVVMNGDEIPYNHNGAIVEVKPIVYECGPSCKCPRSCYNRVTQHGIKIQLEIFKTESRGWGVRSLTSITSGTFICEYVGQLLEDKEAEKRTGNDEYLFDIGQNYNDCSAPDGSSPDKLDDNLDDSGYTIDAAEYGNVGRFINHSCSPNLYAQNVLYDHEDKRMPHIMFFAAENIPPLKELTYHYNYLVDQVHDSNGNIKKKSCYCGSTECTGRMY